MKNKVNFILLALLMLLSGISFAQYQPALAAAPPSEDKPVPKSVTVHITKTGKKYHQAGCSYLSKSDITVDLKTAKAKGLTPCSKCKPPE
jgi:type 1 fimbria pilin